MKYLLILLLLVSCASAKKKAIELSEQGKHEEAIALWAEAIKKDPDDEEIQNGFQASLDYVSNDRLTRTRDKRLANNNQGALEELRGLVELQKKWNIKLDFNSSSFQGKEVQYAWPYYKSTIKTKLDQKLPLAAESDHKIYKDIFNSMKDYQAVQTDITKAGQKKCLVLKQQQGNKPFFTSFVTQFCKYFSAGRDLSSTTISSVLFGRTELEANIKNINETSIGALQTSLDKNLKETPWHHPEAGKIIVMKLSGEYNWTPKTEKIHQAHNYEEKVPYTDYEEVKRKRSVPYDTVVNGVRVTKYRTENYRDKQPVTKYRNVPRVYQYWATKNSLNIAMALKGTIKIDKESYPFFFQKNVREEKILHDINLPKIGLYPQREDVSNPMTKFEVMGGEMALQFKKDLNAIWEKNFCVLPSARDFASVAENVTRCRKLESYPTEFVDGWFKNHFGVTSVRTAEIIGQY